MLKRIVCISMIALLGFGCGDDGGDDPVPDATPTVYDATPTVYDAAPADANPADAAPRVAGTCDSYCTVVTMNCVAPNNNQYDDETACLAACDAAGWEAGYEDDTEGNTIGCRTYHAVAAADTPGTSCTEAGADSTVCVAPALN